MKIMVTGACGYLGGHVVQQLIHKNHQVIAVDNLSSGYNSIDGMMNEVQFIHDDIRNLDRFYDAERIIHLAAIVGEDAYKKDRDEAFSINVDGTYHLCKSKIPMIFASTCSVYGNIEDECTEETEPKPVCMGYAMSKVFAEKLVEIYNGAIFRQATLCGMGITYDSTRMELLPNMIAGKMAKNENIELYSPLAMRPYLHVRDSARAFVEHATSDQFMPGLWNLVQSNINKNNLFGEFKILLKLYSGSEYKTESEIINATTDEDARNYSVSDAKATKELDYVPSYTINKAMLEVFNYIRQNMNDG